MPPQLYSSSLGASARVTVVSVTCGVGAPTVVSFTVVPAVPRLPSASNGAHSRSCAGSVSACQTFSGGWRSSLTRTSVHFSPSFRTSRPAGRARCVLLAIGHRLSPPCLLFVAGVDVIHAVEVAFERIDVSGPEPAERRQPGIHLLKRFRLQPVETALRVHRGFHETGLAQHPQVLGHGRLRHPQLTLDLAHRLFRRDQQAQYRAAVRLRDDFEDRFHALDIPHTAYACQGIQGVLILRS